MRKHQNGREETHRYTLKSRKKREDSALLSVNINRLFDGEKRNAI